MLNENHSSHTVTSKNDTAFGYPSKNKNNHADIYFINSNASANTDRNENNTVCRTGSIPEPMGSIARAIISMIETRDPYTVWHQRRVSGLAEAIAREMGLPHDEVYLIGIAGILHDLGKFNIPVEILNKPGMLSEIEFKLIKTHPGEAYKILKNTDLPEKMADIIHQHHERLDGSGYPLGLSGNDIIPASRILSVADVVESIATSRPYRPALGLKESLKEISRRKGICFDTRVVDTCIKMFNEKKIILRTMPSANQSENHGESNDIQ